MFRLVVVVLGAVLPGDLLAQGRPLPIIDMHLHAIRGGRRRMRSRRNLLAPTCWGAATDEILMKTTLEILERRNISFGVGLDRLGCSSVGPSHN